MFLIHWLEAVLMPTKNTAKQLIEKIIARGYTLEMSHPEETHQVIIVRQEWQEGIKVTGDDINDILEDAFNQAEEEAR